MNNLTKIAALPTGGGCQSALRPEDRGVSSNDPGRHGRLINMRSITIVGTYVPTPPEKWDVVLIGAGGGGGGALALGVGGSLGSMVGKGGAC